MAEKVYVCTNDACPEVEIPKIGNDFGVAVCLCGGCGQVAEKRDVPGGFVRSAPLTGPPQPPTVKPFYMTDQEWEIVQAAQAEMNG